MTTKHVVYLSLFIISDIYNKFNHAEAFLTFNFDQAV